MGAWVSGKLRLLLEWVTLPLLLTAMQLPHGAVLYWLTSSSLALAQHLALRAGAVRAAVGLPPREKACLWAAPTRLGLQGFMNQSMLHCPMSLGLSGLEF